MRKFSLHILLLLLIILAPVFYIWLKPLNKNFAFYYVKDDCYSHGMWIENRIKNTHDSIDWVFIGSSHTIHAIVDYRLQDSIKAKTGKNVTIASFGYCRYGLDIWYVFFKDLLKYQRPKRLFLEVNWRFENNDESHLDFGYTADLKDILQVSIKNDSNFCDNLKKASIIRIESFKAEFLNAYDVPKSGYEKWGYISDATEVENPNVLNSQIAEMKEIFEKTDTNAAIYQKQNSNIISYYERIFKLADEYKIPITFYYVPVYGAPECPIDSLFFTSKGNLLLPPDYIFSNKTNWMDSYHLNNNGAYQYTDWILTQCLPFLNAETKEKGNY